MCKRLQNWIFAMLVASALPGFSQPNARPNIILILADELGYGSLGCYGNKELKTRNIDRLAADGVRLADFHSNGAMCSPTRAALLTGRYPSTEDAVRRVKEKVLG